VDQDFIRIEKYLNRTGLIKQCIDYIIQDIVYVDYHDIFYFNINWTDIYAINTIVVYMPFYQYIEEYDRHISFKYSTDLTHFT